MKYLISILLMVSFQLSGQSWYSRHTIDWSHPVSEINNNPAGLLTFKNANYKNYNAQTGYYFEKILWEKPVKDLNIAFYSVDYEEIGLGYIFPDIKNLDSEIEYSLGIESGKNFLQVSVNPFHLNKETGNVERIKSFILKIDAKGDTSQNSGISGKKSLSESSLLSNGNWYKIKTGESGIYKLSFKDLNQIGISNPANTRIYGWGGKRLPENASQGDQDELLPVQTFVFKGNDGIFNEGDFILFYAEGLTSWTYDQSISGFKHDKNNYSDFGYYFLTSDLGQTIEPADAVMPSNPDYFSDTYNYRDSHEKDAFNPILSGKEWLGEKFDLTTQQEFSFTIPDIRTDESVMVETSLYSRAKDTANFFVYINNKIVDTAFIRKTTIGDYTATYAYPSNEIYSSQINSQNLKVKLKYNKSDPTAEGILDYLTINARAKLSMSSDQLLFRDARTVSAGRVTEFSLANANSNTRIWKINDIHSIQNIPFQINQETARFTIETSLLNEFVAFDINGQFPSPDYSGEGLGLIENQDLHQIGHPDLIIITYPGFKEEAERLAEFRQEHNGMETFITDVEHIYNDFSSGRPDVTAIRNFLRHVYQSAGGNKETEPRYLLLFGDGSFEFKNAGAEEDNYVPTYQSDNSISPTFSYVSDDFFGILDDGESMYSGLLDIGIGRLPVKSLYEARLMVDKIIAYESPDKMGDWRNSICFIGDDEDFNIHFNQADELANYVESNYPAFNISKIYLDAFKQETTSKGDRYPDVNKSINEQVSKGALIINYTGHGGTKGLAHERILDLNDISSWENNDKLPLFMTATCEFSRYDEPDIVSAGEEVILNPEGGGIALLTTTRLVYSGPNHVLNERFYEIVFDKDQDGNNYCLGDIMKYSKNNAGFGVNKRNFTLLGDPAMRLTYPFYKVITDSINSIPVDQFKDTVKAFSEVTFSGHISNSEGEILDDFNGFTYPIIFDKAITQRTLGNDGGSTKTFKSRKNVIYKGKVSVINGRFSFSFIIPKDINYSVGSGRISYYATDSLTDASGADNSFIIGGSSESFEEDFDGPELEVFMNNNLFREGGITSENPVLYVQVKDKHGINTTGNGIGHDIIAVLNDDNQNSFVLNEYYQSDLDSYSSGIIEYPLFNLEEGKYEIRVKVWDIYNNSSEATTEFVVLKTNELVLENLRNLPNPFSSFTEISFEHNKSNSNFDISLDIYTTQGELIKSIKTKQFSNGFRSEPIIWNADSDSSFGVRQGIYIYRVRVKASDGTESEKSGRMILAR